VGHREHMKRYEMHRKYYTDNFKKEYLEDQRINGRIILKCILDQQGTTVWSGFN
jgi:hypothetical protein